MYCDYWLFVTVLTHYWLQTQWHTSDKIARCPGGAAAATYGFKAENVLQLNKAYWLCLQKLLEPKRNIRAGSEAATALTRGACCHFLCRMWPRLTLHRPPGVLPSLNHLVPDLHFLRAPHDCKRQMALWSKIKASVYWKKTQLEALQTHLFSQFTWIRANFHQEKKIYDRIKKNQHH